MIMAAGTIVPEIERVLSSPVDARVLRILKRPGARVERGDAVVELDTSESVLALDKLQSGLQVKENEQAQRRLTLQTSLADIDGRIAVKQLEVESAEARLAGARRCSQGLLRELRRVGAGHDPGRVERQQCANHGPHRGSTKSPRHADVERGTLGKERPGAYLVDSRRPRPIRAASQLGAVQEAAVSRGTQSPARRPVVHRVDETVSTSTSAGCTPECGGVLINEQQPPHRHNVFRPSRKASSLLFSLDDAARRLRPRLRVASTSSPTARCGRCASPGPL